MSNVKRLLDEATPLPWGLGRSSGPPHYVAKGPKGGGNVLCQVFGSKDNADLIVHAVNHLPEYEAAVDALEGLIASVQSSSRQLTEPWGEGQWAGVGLFVGDLEPEFGEALAVLARLRGSR